MYGTKLFVMISVSLFVLTACTGINPSLTGCTKEAKICPDGSYVGRAGPNCEFQKCQAPTSFGITREKLDSLNETACMQSGYDWVNLPGLCSTREGGHSCGNRCDIGTNDAGKKCHSSDECEGACLCTKNKKDADGFQIGECSKYKYFSEVLDCPCVLKTKSKNENYPYGCA